MRYLAPLLTVASLLVAAPALGIGAKKKSATPDPDATCEDAKRNYVDDLGANKGAPPDLSAEDYAAVLKDGSYLNACNVPSDMAVTVCAAVLDGKAVGVTITTRPHDADVASCVSRQVRGMSFPAHPRMDVATTTFAPPPPDAPRKLTNEEPRSAEAPPPVPKSGGCNCSIDARRDDLALASLPLVVALLVRRRRTRETTKPPMKEGF